MTDVQPYSWQLSPTAWNDLERLPEGVACAAIELIQNAIVMNPERCGGPLHDRWAGCLSARLGQRYRIVYEVDHEARMVSVARVRDRSRVYHQ